MFLGSLAFVPSGIALGILMAGGSPGDFGWISLILYGVGLAMIVLRNYMRFREIRCYRVRTGTVDFDLYIERGHIP